MNPLSSSRPIRPPSWSFFSKTSTSKPIAPRRIAAAREPIPAPTTATRFARTPAFPQGYSEYTRQMLAGFTGPQGKGAYRALEQTRVVLGNRGAARARAGHPWVYRSDVSEAEGEVGDVVPVFDRRGGYLGRGFYNPRSEITLRMAERRDEPVDESWFRARIDR